MKLIVIGSRSFDNYELLDSKLTWLTLFMSKVDLVTGGSPDVVKMIARWAYDNWCSIEIYHEAFYEPHDMVNQSKAKMLVAFFNGEKCPSDTKDIIKRAKKAGMKTMTFKDKS